MRRNIETLHEPIDAICHGLVVVIKNRHDPSHAMPVWDRSRERQERPGTALYSLED